MRLNLGEVFEAERFVLGFEQAFIYLFIFFISASCLLIPCRRVQVGGQRAGC